jgi:MurNAc alpha-1-phosphate uridylyltransferase
MIFAAGKGTRMAPLTDATPKPMIRVNRRPLLDYALDLARNEGLAPVVNIHHLPTQIRDHVAGTNVQISDETEALLETGGGLRKATPLLGGSPVFTLNSDAIWAGDNPLTQLKQVWDPTRMDALLMLVPLAQAHGHKGTGDFSCGADGRLSRGGSLLYTGAQIIKTAHLSDIPDTAFSLNKLWDILLAKNRVFGVSYSGEWCDVGKPESLPLAQALLNRTQDV